MEDVGRRLFGPVDHFGDVALVDRTPLVNRDHQRGDLVDVAQESTGLDQHLAVGLFEGPGRRRRVLHFERGDQGRGIDPGSGSVPGCAPILSPPRSP